MKYTFILIWLIFIDSNVVFTKYIFLIIKLNVLLIITYFYSVIIINLSNYHLSLLKTTGCLLRYLICACGGIN